MFYIGQFCDAYLPVVDGVIMVVKHYSELINKYYGKCSIVAPEVPNYKDDGELDVIRIKSIPIPKRAPYRYAIPELHKSAVDKIMSCRFDLIHTHSPFGISQYGLKVAKRRDIPIISTFHSKYYDDFKQVLKVDSFAQIAVNYIIEYYNQVDQVWTVNNSTAQTLKDYGYKGSINVIPNGSDMVYPQNADELIDRAANKYNIPRDKPVFIFVGQMIWQKNIKNIILAMAYIKKSGFEFKMIMVGKGSAEEEIKELVRKEGLWENFIFTGVVYDRNELSGLYMSADIFVFPSIYDNAPLVVKEAAGLGLPALVIRNSNASEGIEDCVNGFISEDGFENIGNKIVDIYKSGVDKKAVGKRAADTLPVSWEKVVEEVYGRYTELIKFKNKLR